MARIRTIKPEFWESESVGRLSMGARLLFIACLNFADDEGLLRWNEAYLSSQAFVYDELDTESISEWMGELVREGIVFPYKAATTNQRLGWIVCFRSHQVINRPQPSKLPPPSIQNTDFKNALFNRDRNTCHLCKNPIDPLAPAQTCGSKAPSIDHVIPKSRGGGDYPSNLRTAHISCNKARKDKPLDGDINDSVNESLIDSVAEVELEGKRKQKGKEKTEGASPPASAPVPLGTRFSVLELPEDWKAYCAEKRPDLNPDSVFEGFRDYWVAVPGSRGRKADWPATWRRWVRETRGTGASGATPDYSQVIANLRD